MIAQNIFILENLKYRNFEMYIGKSVGFYYNCKANISYVVGSSESKSNHYSIIW